jgi:hypothetical protein
VFFTWAGPSSVTRLAEQTGAALDSLTDSAWQRLARTLIRCIAETAGDSNKFAIDVSRLPATTSQRVILVTAHRCDQFRRSGLFQEFLASYNGDDPIALEFCQSHALFEAVNNPAQWQQTLDIIERSYAKGAVSDPYYGYRYARSIEKSPMPVAIAQEVMQKADRFPTDLVNLAEGICRQDVAYNVQPVGRVAEIEKWFAS